MRTDYSSSCSCHCGVQGSRGLRLSWARAQPTPPNAASLPCGASRCASPASPFALSSPAGPLEGTRAASHSWLITHGNNPRESLLFPRCDSHRDSPLPPLEPPPRSAHPLAGDPCAPRSWAGWAPSGQSGGGGRERARWPSTASGLRAWPVSVRGRPAPRRLAVPPLRRRSGLCQQERPEARCVCGGKQGGRGLRTPSSPPTPPNKDVFDREFRPHSSPCSGPADTQGLLGGRKTMGDIDVSGGGCSERPEAGTTSSSIRLL